MEDNYLIVREYEERIADSKSEKHPEFISFKHENGSFYFAWIKQGKVFLRSEGYATAAARDNGVLSVIKNGADRNNYRTASAHGAHFLYLVAGNNKEIARSYPMKEEIEAFIALGLLSEAVANASETIPEVSDNTDEVILEEKSTTSDETTIVEETPESDEIIDTDTTLASDSIDTVIPQIESNVIELEEIKTPIHEETDKKLLSTPLLESFQKEVKNTEAPTSTIPEEELKTEKEEELPLNLISEEPILNIAETTIEEPVTVTIDRDKPIEQVIDLKEATDYLYSNTEKAEKKTKLGAILEEETMEAKKGSWRWLLWLILIALLAAILWWLFQMKGCETIGRIVNKDKAADSAARIKQDGIHADTSQQLDAASLQAKATWEKTLGGMVAIRLPDGSVLNVPENGTEKRLVEYLEAKCGTSELKKTWFDMDRILFKSGTDELKEISDEQITLLAKIFKSYPNKKFKIGGYTDNVGNPEANIRLSAIRAAAATRAIASKGIDSARMRYEGYGQEHPICPANDTEECRAKNRRVAIRVDVCE
jgi:outer membrane protein OmpA-like peptidoglycan-associated protein/uncharacterized protein YegP (UPF0339 family)